MGKAVVKEEDIYNNCIKIILLNLCPKLPNHCQDKFRSHCRHFY